MAPLSVYHQEAEQSIPPTPIKINCPQRRISKVKSVVTFHESVKVRRTIHINNYTPEEVRACWYDHAEEKAIRADARFTARMLNDGTLTEQDSEQCCRRGVEHLVRSNMVLKQKLRLTAWLAVFEEQDFQADEGIREPEYIAHAYQAATKAAAKRARAVGLKDHLDSQM